MDFEWICYLSGNLFHKMDTDSSLVQWSTVIAPATLLLACLGNPSILFMHDEKEDDERRK